MMLRIKTMSVLKVSTYIISSIAPRPTGLSVILAIVSVSTFIAAVIIMYLRFIITLVKGVFVLQFDERIKTQIYLKGIENA